MIAMQYRFVLPADYDMQIIARRIRDKGPLLDGFPHLRCKAYLSATRQAGSGVVENRYAPFYLWDSAAGIDAFLASPGFAALARDFGWPVVQTWLVWHAHLAGDVGDAAFATESVVPIAPYSDLAELRTQAHAQDAQTLAAGALAAVSGFDPGTWTCVRFQLWRARPADAVADADDYFVGHVSLPGHA